MRREIANAYQPSFRGARSANPESIQAAEWEAQWIPGLRQEAHPGMRRGEYAASLAVIARSKATKQSIFPQAAPWIASLRS